MRLILKGRMSGMMCNSQNSDLSESGILGCRVMPF